MILSVQKRLGTMGKHNTKSGTGANRSRNRRDSILDVKPLRRAKRRLSLRRQNFDEVMSKSPRWRGYNRPGSLKMRPN